MARLFTLVVLGMTLVSTLAEAKSIRIHVIGKIVEVIAIYAQGAFEVKRYTGLQHSCLNRNLI